MDAKQKLEKMLGIKQGVDLEENKIKMRKELLNLSRKGLEPMAQEYFSLLKKGYDGKIPARMYLTAYRLGEWTNNYRLPSSERPGVIAKNLGEMLSKEKALHGLDINGFYVSKANLNEKDIKSIGHEMKNNGLYVPFYGINHPLDDMGIVSKTAGRRFAEEVNREPFEVVKTTEFLTDTPSEPIFWKEFAKEISRKYNKNAILLFGKEDEMNIYTPFGDFKDHL